MKIRHYAAPLTMLRAGALGIGLFCSVAAIALNGMNKSSRMPLKPLNIVDVAISNFSTSAVMTERAVVAFLPSSTTVPTHISTIILTLTPIPPMPSDVPTIVALYIIIEPTRTQRPRLSLISTGTPIPSATKTPMLSPTRTLTPTSTKTAIIVPAYTNTSIPT